MKFKNSIPVGWQSVILAVVVIGICAVEPAYCQGEGIALLLQKAPANGGVVNIGVGVHHFGRNTEVTLTATPKPGYHFAYWLGDVSDPMANNTVVYMDVPKIIIAVFERAKHDFPVSEESMSYNAPFGGLMAHAGDYARRGGGGIGGRRPRKWRWPERPEPPEPLDNLPVPTDSNDFPVPIPEPATGILLAVGTWAALGIRRRKKIYTLKGNKCPRIKP